MERGFISLLTPSQVIYSENISQTPYYNKYSPFNINKSNLSEYISINSPQNEGLHVNEELSAITNEDELMVIKYVLDIMKEHDIITEEEYHKVLYKYS